jgi:hypothetical protein
VMVMVTTATFTAVTTSHALIIILTVSHDLFFTNPCLLVDCPTYQIGSVRTSYDMIGSRPPP